MKLLFFLLTLASLATAAPKISFPIPAGTVQEESLAQGEKIYKLPITNIGDSPLTISQIRPSCSCTKVLPAPPVTINPGATNLFECTVDLGGELKKGPKNFAIRFVCDDPENQNPNWFITVPILPCIELLPRTIRFDKNSAPTQTVSIIYHGPLPEFPIKGRFLADLFGAPSEPKKDPENFLAFKIEETESPLTNKLTIAQKQKEVFSRYGTLRLSLDAGPKFNILQIETEKFPALLEMKDAE